MVLSRVAYLKRLGLPEQILSDQVTDLLLNMIKASTGAYSDDQVVVVSGTVETQDLQLVVKPISGVVTT